MTINSTGHSITSWRATKWTTQHQDGDRGGR
jgi:hypothetical protein